jgi:hypothetical protein
MTVVHRERALVDEPQRPASRPVGRREIVRKITAKGVIRKGEHLRRQTMTGADLGDELVGDGDEGGAFLDGALLEL